MIRKHNILCFLDSDSGRDVEIVMPVIAFAEQYLNSTVHLGFTWDLDIMYRLKPELVMLPNTVGSKLYFEISQYAHQQNIPVFALTSEGNIRTDGSFYYWGYNTDKTFYQKYLCCWSGRTRDFLRSELPEIAERIVFTGATGFDRYRIFNFAEKHPFLSKAGKGSYKKVIGYAGWAFGKLSNEQGIEEVLHYFKGDRSGLKWMENQMLEVEAILKTLIEKNPDILFILKRHPNEANPSITVEGQNEMNRLQHYDNVWYVNDRTTNIHDLISVSDLWMSFESTTAMETWMMGYKPTIFLNPDPDFNRDPTYKGTVMVESSIAAQRLIDEFYQSGRIQAFDVEEKVAARKEIIEYTIGSDDGLNHVRAGYYLEKTLPVENRAKYFRKQKYLLMNYLMRLGSLVYYKPLFLGLPKFKKTTWIFDNFRLKKATVRKKEYLSQTQRFYQNVISDETKPSKEKLYNKANIKH